MIGSVEKPEVSVLLVTRNGMATLPAVWSALAAQVASFRLETIAIDSESSDGTAEFLASRADRLLRIPRREFDHGLTRNRGIELCRGDLVVLLVQDATPASTEWLGRLIAPLRGDPSVAGSFARQLPRPGASALTRFYAARWAAASDRPRMSAVAGSAAFAALSPAARHDLCAFDNVCSCIRRSVWAQIPFRATPIAEDLEWAREVLLAGQRLAYAPDAVVLHSHERSAREEYRRTVDVHRRLGALFGLRTIPSRRALAAAILWCLRTHGRLARAYPAQLPRALALALAYPVGQYAGGRGAARATRAA